MQVNLEMIRKIHTLHPCLYGNKYRILWKDKNWFRILLKLVAITMSSLLSMKYAFVEVSEKVALQTFKMFPAGFHPHFPVLVYWPFQYSKHDAQTNVCTFLGVFSICTAFNNSNSPHILDQRDPERWHAWTGIRLSSFWIKKYS